jgi:succinate dehydrogenase / fumarate reductase cytochrome b subunit
MRLSPYVNLPVPVGLPTAFLFRRLHSIAGLFFILFLIEHMLTNSTAALFVSEEGSGFVRAVNFLQSLPYLPLIEFFLLAVPIAIHAFLGIWYFTEARFTSFPSNGSKPYLPFIRNYFFTWQRLAALILVVGVTAHVASMRFIQRPTALDNTPETKYVITVAADPGLVTLAPRLQLMLLTPHTLPDILSMMERSEQALAIPAISDIDRTYYQERLATQRAHLATIHPTEELWGVVTHDFGTALLLIVRDNFRIPWICLAYTLFVLAACFHASYGLWTFAISWGIPLNELGRRAIGVVGSFLALALAIGGMVSIWMTYWVTLKQ